VERLVLPPILEIYAVWHPGDLGGETAADQFVEHFHGTTFTGLIGGAVEVYVRSAGWTSRTDAPRPIPLPGTPPPNGIPEARFIAVIPVLGTEFAAAVEDRDGPWHRYATHIRACRDACPQRVGVFPLLIDPGVLDNTRLDRIFGRYQRIGDWKEISSGESDATARCRDLAQGIAQLANGTASSRLTVFISHTNARQPAEDSTSGLLRQVRSIISDTRLNTFLDAQDLLPGSDWDSELHKNAATGALLAIRTDLYASREWCQREITIAKQAGIPVVVLDALTRGEYRGSFLMDHVPRVPVRRTTDGWTEPDICRGLNLLVDECLKRVLWKHQRDLARGRSDLDRSCVILVG
jgi:hypothetical protein